jgi:peroxiredoxin
MTIRAFLTSVAVLGFSVPAWADCGACGSKGHAEKARPHSHADGGHAAAHATSGHAHAVLGQPAPNFTLKDLDGREHTLAELKGKVVVLEWTNHECPFVKRTHGKDATVNRVAAKFKDKPVVWLGVNSSHFAEAKADALRKWANESDLAFPILLDASGEVGVQYGAKTTPHLFVIDQQGTLAYAGALDNDPFGKEERKVNYVEQAVSALLNGSTVATASTKPYGCSVKYRK